MTIRLLEGRRIIDIAGEPLAMAGRLLADMGAEVVKLEPPGGDPLRQVAPLDAGGVSLRFMAWNAGKTSVEYRPDDADIAAMLQGADAVLETPGFPGALALPRDSAPGAVWLAATPFGGAGPRAHWRATDLGIMAACGNMNATGYPDRPPLRCTEPAGYAHCGAEAAFAVVTALASGRPQTIDLSMQEAVMIANMGGAGQFPKTGRKGMRQGASMGGTREIWPCRDGYVSFGLRGGPARARNFDILLEQLAAEGLATPAWSERDWKSFNPRELDEEELRAIEAPLLAYFARHTMHELYELTVATNLMLAPANSAAEILVNEQLAARDMFARVGDVARFPARFFLCTDAGGAAAPVTPPAPAPALDAGPVPRWPSRQSRESAASPAPGTPAWAGLNILEFGSGAAGPIATRYFSEHGATIIRVESHTRPDFLRSMAVSGGEGIEGSSLFDVLNPGKKSITLNLKHPDGVAIAKRLVQWADAVVENFAPKAMKSWGLDYTALVREKPDLVMLSTCLNGQTGPHRDYPGFGGQGSALSGYNYLTGLPDREPIGPFGTITDSLSPRFAAAVLAAALLHKRRTGKGLYLDVSQVETGVFSLSPWLLEESVLGTSHSRMGNRSQRAVPHGAFPCDGEDRWIAIACWNDDQWRRLAAMAGIDKPRYADLPGRLSAEDEIEAAVNDWTRSQRAGPLAEKLQEAGIEAVPVANFKDLIENDAQLAARAHFVPLERAVTGLSHYERNGFRLSDSPSRIERPTPLLGEHTQEILRDCLGYSESAIDELAAGDALQ
ncbi:MAG: CoA transferase [Halioglobus sp.]|nr:CoA transferase [Halioglobus sp.]